MSFYLMGIDPVDPVFKQPGVAVVFKVEGCMQHIPVMTLVAQYVHRKEENFSKEVERLRELYKINPNMFFTSEK